MVGSRQDLCGTGKDGELDQRVGLGTPLVAMSHRALAHRAGPTTTRQLILSVLQVRLQGLWKPGGKHPQSGRASEEYPRPGVLDWVSTRSAGTTSPKLKSNPITHTRSLSIHPGAGTIAPRVKERPSARRPVRAVADEVRKDARGRCDSVMASPRWRGTQSQ